MENDRRHRFKRSKKAQAQRHRLTEKDMEILQVLARYRYLRTQFLLQLVERKYDRASRYSLRKLFDHGYINKPTAQHRGSNSLYTPDIYELDDKGFKVLQDAETEVTRLTREKTYGTYTQFAHSMMVCDTLASIEIGVLHSDCTFITWREIVARAKVDKPLNLPFSFSYRLANGSMVNRRDQRLIPDGLFGIRYPNGKASFFLLETEHGNPIIPSEDLKRASFLKKYLGYKDMRKQGTFEKQLGIKAVRVLFVVPTKAKAHTMIKFIEKDMGESTLFLFTDVPVQEDIMGAPPPFPELFEAEWKRAGMEPVSIHLTK